MTRSYNYSTGSETGVELHSRPVFIARNSERFANYLASAVIHHLDIYENLEKSFP